MNIAELDQLEIHVDQIIGNMERLRSENTLLQQKLSQVAHECNQFREANQTAADLVKRLIAQLKEDIND